MSARRLSQATAPSTCPWAICAVLAFTPFSKICTVMGRPRARSLAKSYGTTTPTSSRPEPSACASAPEVG